MASVRLVNATSALRAPPYSYRTRCALTKQRQLRSFTALSPADAASHASDTATATETAAATASIPAEANGTTISAQPMVAHRSDGPTKTNTTPRSREGELPKRYFNPSHGTLSGGPGPQGKPPDENRANLGRTLRILQDRLPTLLQSPLQQDILAPNISLHLFPTTHPHLPTVSGRVAYTAALWTSPIAWNRVPVIGNVRLSILSARMTEEPVLPAGTGAPARHGAVPEQLVVRWCTCGVEGQPSHEEHMLHHQLTDEGSASGPNGGAGSGRGRGEGVGGKKKRRKHFSGLFIFQFDKEGRILSHTIETVQGGGDWEKGVGAKVVGLTDWLLGGLGSGEPSPAFRRLDDGLGSEERRRHGRR